MPPPNSAQVCCHQIGANHIGWLILGELRKLGCWACGAVAAACAGCLHHHLHCVAVVVAATTNLHNTQT